MIKMAIGSREKTEYAKHQIRAIVRRLPGITQQEILDTILEYKMPGNWYQQKVSRLLWRMILDGNPLEERSEFDARFGRKVLKYYYKDDTQKSRKNSGRRA
jgi:hypothetical protein